MYEQTCGAASFAVANLLGGW